MRFEKIPERTTRLVEVVAGGRGKRVSSTRLGLASASLRSTHTPLSALQTKSVQNSYSSREFESFDSQENLFRLDID